MSENQIALLPCPFCGGDAAIGYGADSKAQPTTTPRFPWRGMASALCLALAGSLILVGETHAAMGTAVANLICQIAAELSVQQECKQHG